MIQLLTCTGGRPEAFALCQRWMSAQDYNGQVKWVIVDDGPEASSIIFDRSSWDLVVIRPTPLWQPGQNTQARNMLAGLKSIDPARPCLCIEDDDHYKRDWITHCAPLASRYDLIGENLARYYNVATKVGRQLSNGGHASLCSTGFKGDAYHALVKACEQNAKFIDLQLWRNWRGSKQLFGGHRVTGIKGLPGRGGIGMGHRKDLAGQRDPDGSLLRKWIGDDAEAYL